jgi:hypothetical protein
MKTKLEFIDFSISFYKRITEEPPYNLITLSAWLRHNSLDKIKEFPYWDYLINDERNIFKLKREKDKDWYVYKLKEGTKYEFYFSFKPEKGTKFIYEFEKSLKEKLQPPSSGNEVKFM